MPVRTAVIKKIIRMWRGGTLCTFHEMKANTCWLVNGLKCSTCNMEYCSVIKTVNSFWFHFQWGRLRKAIFYDLVDMESEKADLVDVGSRTVVVTQGSMPAKCASSTQCPTPNSCAIYTLHSKLYTSIVLICISFIMPGVDPWPPVWEPLPVSCVNFLQEESKGWEMLNARGH